jgi:hypothetical protein
MRPLRLIKPDSSVCYTIVGCLTNDKRIFPTSRLVKYSRMTCTPGITLRATIRDILHGDAVYDLITPDILTNRYLNIS